MAESNYYTVGDDFNLNELVSKLTLSFTAEEFHISNRPMTSGVSLTFKKNQGTFKKLLGLSLGITVNLSQNNHLLLVNFDNAEWGGKAFAIAVGWFLLWIPFCTGIYGAYKQSELPKEINQRIQAIITGFGVRGA